MQHRISEFLVGLLFGLGLILSGMTDPGKVIGFLDILGEWDPSLALVMAGAIAVGFFAFAFAKKRTANFLGGDLHLPTNHQIDKPLVIGAVLFGAGWGLAGCLRIIKSINLWLSVLFYLALVGAWLGFVLAQA